MAQWVKALPEEPDALSSRSEESDFLSQASLTSTYVSLNKERGNCPIFCASYGAWDIYSFLSDNAIPAWY